MLAEAKFEFDCGPAGTTETLAGPLQSSGTPTLSNCIELTVKRYTSGGKKLEEEWPVRKRKRREKDRNKTKSD